MRLSIGKRPRICTPDRIFEELEQRIVLDASLDATVHHDLPDHADAGHYLSHSASEIAVPDSGPATAGHQPDNNDLNVVLISDRLPDLDMLQKASSQHATVIVYDGAKDNLDTVNVKLQHLVDSSGQKIHHLALLDHAKAGQVWIGADKIDLFAAAARRGSFETLGQTLSDHAQIQLYGCSIAGDPMGQALIDRIALYTHADVFASVNKTGGSHSAAAAEHPPLPAASTIASAVNEQPSAAVEALHAGPVAESTGKHAIVAFGSSRILVLSNSFHVSDSNHDESVVASVTYNPDPQIGQGITDLKLRQAANSAAKITSPAPGSTTWTIEGTPNDVDSVLQTMKASVRGDFQGDAQVKLTVASHDPMAPESSTILTVPVGHGEKTSAV